MEVPRIGGLGPELVNGDFHLGACWLYGVFYHGYGACVECSLVGWIDCARRTGDAIGYHRLVITAWFSFQEMFYMTKQKVLMFSVAIGIFVVLIMFFLEGGDVCRILPNIGPDGASSVVAAPLADGDAFRPQPVVDSMHQFMEYVFEPNYHQLKEQLAVAQPDKAGWRVIKEGALTLAEGGNLLLLRTPDENADSWNAMSIAVRNVAGELYRAARQRKAETASQKFREMLKKCNSCHDDFAGGKYLLEP